VNLVFRLRKPGDRPKRPLGDGRGPGCVGHGQDVLLDFGGQAQQAHDLGDASPGDSLAAGDLGLVADSAGFEEGPRLEGLAEKLDNTEPAKQDVGFDDCLRHPQANAGPLGPE
jgi:hypothetical protein